MTQDTAIIGQFDLILFVLLLDDKAEIGIAYLLRELELANLCDDVDEDAWKDEVEQYLNSASPTAKDDEVNDRFETPRTRSARRFARRRRSSITKDHGTTAFYKEIASIREQQSDSRKPRTLRLKRRKKALRSGQPQRKTKSKR